MSLLFNMLSRFVIPFLSRSKHVLISWLQSPSAVILILICISLMTTVVLEKTLESPLDSKEIQPVHPKGNESRILIGRTDAEAETPILWSRDEKN